MPVPLRRSSRPHNRDGSGVRVTTPRVQALHCATASQGSAGQYTIANCIVIASPPLVYVINERIDPAHRPEEHLQHGSTFIRVREARLLRTAFQLGLSRATRFSMGTGGEKPRFYPSGGRVE